MGTAMDEWNFSKPTHRVQWPYQKWFRAHIQSRIRYDFVRQNWDRDIAEMKTLEKLRAEEMEPSAVKLSNADRKTLDRIEKADVATLMAFLDRVASQEDAASFCKTARIKPSDLIELLRKIFKYLPFGAQMRQLVEKEDTEFQAHVDRLVDHKLGHSLALLAAGRTRKDRSRLSKQTGIPARPLLDLIKRADLTRLKLMSGGMVRTSWAIGYKGLSALKKATPKQFHTRCKKHYGDRMPFDWSMQNMESHIARMKQATTLIEE